MISILPEIEFKVICQGKGRISRSQFSKSHRWGAFMFHKHILLHFPKQALVFMCLQFKCFENSVGKGEIARNKQFLLLPQCFLPFWITSCHFHQIANCRLQTLSVWQSLKFVVWERVNRVCIHDPCLFKPIP